MSAREYVQDSWRLSRLAMSGAREFHQRRHHPSIFNAVARAEGTGRGFYSAWIGESCGLDVYGGTFTDPDDGMWFACAYPGIYQGRQAILQFVVEDGAQYREFIEYTDINITQFTEQESDNQ